MQGIQHHHTYWPRRAYRGNRVTWAFRQLPCHIVLIKAEDHTELHRSTSPPKMPSREYMLLVLLAHKEGHCPLCHRREP